MWFLSGKVSAGHGVMLIANRDINGDSKGLPTREVLKFNPQAHLLLDLSAKE